MRIAKVLPVSLMLAALTTPALAFDQGDTYLGGGFSRITYDQDGLGDASPSAIIGRLGYFITDQIAIEGRAGLGVGDDNVTVSGVDVNIEVEQVAGAYALGHLPVADVFSLYGLVGFTYGELSASALGVSLDDDDTDFSYGIGGELRVAQNVSAYAEWAKYFDESSYDVTGITVGANYRF